MNRFRSRFRDEIGAPKYKVGDSIGQFLIIFYQGHSAVHKRSTKIMSKAHHWYRCKCTCGIEESRTQQELSDTRRKQMCYACRNPNPTKPKGNKESV